MENSIILARIIGPYLAIVGVGLLFNIKTCKKIIEGFEDNQALVYTGGILALLLGLILVNIHNIWELSWTVIITIIAWLAVIKGASLLICPQKFLKLTEVFHKNTAVLVTHIIIIILLGAYLSYVSFLA